MTRDDLERVRVHVGENVMRERLGSQIVRGRKRRIDDFGLPDIQRIEPVDMVLNRRIDARHTAPTGLYGYEPMNDKWNRDFTRLGGDFYQATPGGGWTETARISGKPKSSILRFRPTIMTL